MLVDILVVRLDDHAQRRSQDRVFQVIDRPHRRRTLRERLFQDDRAFLREGQRKRRRIVTRQRRLGDAADRLHRAEGAGRGVGRGRGAAGTLQIQRDAAHRPLVERNGRQPHRPRHPRQAACLRPDRAFGILRQLQVHLEGGEPAALGPCRHRRRSPFDHRERRPTVQRPLAQRYRGRQIPELVRIGVI